MELSRLVEHTYTRAALPIVFALALLPCICFAQARVIQDGARPVEPTTEGHEWAEQTLKGLSLEEKVGQMLQVRYFADYRNFDSYDYKYLRNELQKYHIGSVVFGMHFNRSGPMRSSPLDAARVANQLQSDSKLPLLVAADLERGVASRLSDVPAFPWPMAFGAVDDPIEVERFAAITGQEARAIGVQWALAPVADVNISAVSFLLAHFLISACGGSGASEEESISPKWSRDLHSAIEGVPLGVVAGGKGHEYEYKPQTSLWFTDNETIVVTFVVRRGDGSPKLAHRGVSDENLPLRLRALFLDAATGKIKATLEWPAESRRDSIVAAHDGKFVTQTGENLTLYSSDMKELKKLSTPTMEKSDLVSSPTGRTVLFTVRTSSTVRWTWVDADSLEVLRSWEENPRGRVSISDSKIVMTACTLWFYKCEPEIDVKGRDTSWKRVATIEDRRHPPIAAFVGDDLLFLLGPSITFLRTDGTTLRTEPRSFEGCWWGGIYASSGGQRVVVPSCKLRGRVESLDLGGHDELKKIFVYDSPFQEHPYVIGVKGPKIKELTLLAISPDGSKLAALNGESIHVFQLPLLR